MVWTCPWCQQEVWAEPAAADCLAGLPAPDCPRCALLFRDRTGVPARLAMRPSVSEARRSQAPLPRAG